MSRAFQYRPRFVDIRVKPPKPDEDVAAEAEEDVFRLKPGEKPCDFPGCRRAGEARAPKSRERMGDFYWFCTPHAAEYNKGWDYFAGMSEGEIRRRREEESMTGGRPTWSFKADARSREAAAFAAKMGGPNGKPGWDPFNVFGSHTRRQADPVAPDGRHLGRLERQALADLDLDKDADAGTIRVRYLELVKRCHPDTNGGDRGAEDKLQRVIKAYKTLQAAKLV
jgi:hypothetical protein